MNILVLGWYYSRNLGDAVLCSCVEQRLRQHYPNAKIEIRDLAGRQDFSDGEDYPDYKTRRRTSRRNDLRRLVTGLGWDRIRPHVLWRMRRAPQSPEEVCRGDWDAAVFAGGQLFMDDLALYVQQLTACLARRKIPVFFNAIGLGPSQSRQIRRELIRVLALDNVYYVSCRDDVETLNRWLGGRNGVLVSDPALWTDQVFGIRKDPDSQTVGLGMLYPKNVSSRACLRFWKRVIRKLNEKNIRWKIFTDGDTSDQAFARMLLEQIPELAGTAEEHLCPVPRSPQALAELIASFQGLISFRLHSHIIGASLDIPSVAVVWDRKVSFFFQKIRHPERCVSVKASADRVVTLLFQAQAEGYDRSTLEQQRIRSETMLFTAMDAVLNPSDR